MKKIATLCAHHQIPLLSDTTQYIGKLPFDFQRSQLNFAVSSSHKVGALIGSGLILAQDPGKLKPLILGGGQEQGLRSGTQNYLAHETYGMALEYCLQQHHQLDHLNHMRQDFEQKLKATLDCQVIGENAPRVPGTSLLWFPHKSGKQIQFALERLGIMTTTSSACHDRTEHGSHVLKAMGYEPQTAQSVVRVSLGAHKAPTQYQPILDALTQIVGKLSPSV